MQLKLNKTKKKNHYVFWIVLAYVKLRRRSKKSRHRRFVLQQWLKTQRSFMADLNLAINFIKKPLVDRGIIDKQGVSILCPQFQQMKQLSQLMIETVSIIEKQKNSNKIILGEQLKHFGNFYKLYGTYFGNRLKSEQLIRQLFEQREAVMRQVEQKFKAEAKAYDIRKQNMTMSDCLQQPQYRMFKYVLLLKDYVKKLPRWHPDFVPMQGALQVFEDTNQSHNDRMAKLQAQAKKIKLDKLFGKSIQDSSHYIVEMSADSLYFPVKMYIFSNLVIVSAVENILGFMDERRFLNIQLNEFSMAHKKPDAKYFKNGILLCGQYRALHFFTQDPGSRQEIVSTIQKVVKELQTKASQKRQQKAIGLEGSRKLNFVLHIGPVEIFAPEFRIQVVQIEVRPLGTFSNDTVYLTRFACPLWWQDLAEAGLEEGKTKRGIWQLVQVHMSQVVQLLEHLRQKYPEVQFPEVDPLTKQVNIVTQGKKNTKMFEVRGYLLQQFFNFIFRHPTVMGSPLEIISRYKLLQPFWKYSIDKNNYLMARGDSCKQLPNQYLYGAAHCKICSLVLKAGLQEIQNFRGEVMRSGNAKDTCFNALNLLRLRFAAMQEKEFDTIERVLLRQLLQSGRIDYALIERGELHKREQYIPIQGCGQSKQFMLYGDYKKMVGQYIIDLGAYIGLEDALDCRLLLRYEGKERILDQDEVVFDLITKYQLQAEQRENNSRNSRASYNVTSIQKQEGFLSGIFSIFKGKMNSSLVFRKIVYLPKQIEIRSMMKSLRRGEYVVGELYSRLTKGEIMFEIDDWGQVCALWAVLNLWNQIPSQTINQIMGTVLSKIVPADTQDIVAQKLFTKIFAEAVQGFKKKHGLKPLSDKDKASIYKRCLRVFYRSVRTYTYVTPATVHTVPAVVIKDGLGPILQECSLGINFKEFLVFRSSKSKEAAVRLGLQDVKITHTTFSLFVQYGYNMGGAENNCKEGEKVTLRFDGRMLFHFDFLLRQYVNLRKIFPLTVV